MFDIEYIYELVSGNLSEKAYKNIISSIANMVRKNNWQKSIVTSANINSDYWTTDNIKELAHQFFEWAISKGKFKYLNKIPGNYLSYYFTQIFISFVANRISEEQQKKGLSYEKCQELVFEISKEKYYSKEINGIIYLFSDSFENEDIKNEVDIDSSLKYLSHYKIPENTKHYKPLVAMVLEDIFNLIDYPIELSKLIKTVFNLFDQSFFTNSQEEEIYQEEIKEDNQKKYQSAIQSLLGGLSKNDAQIISEYLFQSNGEISLSTLAEKFQLSKSTIHHKIESFKKKILEIYFPENEDDGINFLQNLSSALDELTK